MATVKVLRLFGSVWIGWNGLKSLLRECIDTLDGEERDRFIEFRDHLESKIDK